TLRAFGSVSLSGALSTTADSRIEVEGDGAAGTSTLTVANGFTNLGIIELRSVTSAYNAGLIVTNGTLTNAASGDIVSAVGTGGSRSLGAALDNQGLMIVGQALTLNGSNAAHVNSGSIEVEANLSVVQSGIGASFTNTGTITVPAGRTL